MAGEGKAGGGGGGGRDVRDEETSSTATSPEAPAADALPTGGALAAATPPPPPPQQQIPTREERASEGGATAAPTAAPLPPTTVATTTAGINVRSSAFGAAASAALAQLQALDATERRLLTDVVGGIQRAQALYHKKAEECRRLRTALKHAQRAHLPPAHAPSLSLSPTQTSPPPAQQQQQQQVPSSQRRRERRTAGVTTSGFRFGDRVVFVRRGGCGAAGMGGGGACSGGGTAAAAAASHQFAYAALREGSGDMPHFLSKASERTLIGCQMGRSGSAHPAGSMSPAAAARLLPPVAMGSVVHIEYLVAPHDEPSAAALGLRPGAEYALITAEMSDPLATLPAELA